MGDEAAPVASSARVTAFAAGITSVLVHVSPPSRPGTAFVSLPRLTASATMTPNRLP